MIKEMAQSDKRGHIAYTEEELLFGIKMMEGLSKITDMLLYFLDRKNIKFTYIIIQVDDETFGSLLREQKRTTDILISIDEEKGVYAIVGQETDVEGGYHFAERIMRLLEVGRGKSCLSCNVLTISTTHYDAQSIILRLLERFLDSREKNGETSPHKIDFFTLS